MRMSDWSSDVCSSDLCTKHNYLVKDPADLAAIVDGAFQIATTGRPGPVLIDIPKDVQIATAAWNDGPPQRRQRYAPRTKGAIEEIEDAVAIDRKSTRLNSSH